MKKDKKTELLKQKKLKKTYKQKSPQQIFIFCPYCFISFMSTESAVLDSGPVFTAPAPASMCIEI